ncbi:CHAT domain-containing protein, partial [Vararia minispora EC-137]
QAQRLAEDGASLLGQAMSTSEPEILSAAISRLQDSINLAPDGYPYKHWQLINLGIALRTRFERLGNVNDLQDAVRVLRQAVNLTPDGHIYKPGRFSTLGNALEARFDRLGGLDDLEQAIIAKRQAVHLTPDDHPDRPGRLSNLGRALQTRFDRLGGLDDLEEAIVIKRQAVGLTPDGHPHKAGRLNTLGNALEARFDRFGSLDDLEEAIVVKRQAVNLTPDNDPDMPGRLSNLGNALNARFGGLEDLEEAIMVKRQAVDLAPSSHPDKPACLSNLGNALRTRFDRLGGLDDLQEAIAAWRQAVDLTTDSHPDRLKFLNSIGNALKTRFDRLGTLDDLEEAIIVGRQVVNLTPDNHPFKPRRLGNLGLALETRFDRLGGLNDLEEAIVAKRHAFNLTPDGHPDKPKQFNNLGIALRTRFERLGGPDDLEEAIVAQRQAVKLTPDSHSDKPGRLNNLGFALTTRFGCFRSFDDLEEAIVVKRRAVVLTPDSHPHKPVYLDNLGSVLAIRFNHLGDLDDLKDAITVKRQAVDLAPDGDPSKSGRLNNLGIVIQTRFGQTCNLEDLQLARNVFTLAADQETAPPAQRLRAVKHCLDVCRLQIQSGHATSSDLMIIFNRAFSLIPQVAWLGTSITQRYATLSSIGSIVNDAVSVAIQTGNLSRAVEWLEEGRSVVWGQLLQLRSPVDSLRTHHPDLADNLQSLSRDLEDSSNDTRSGNIHDLLSIVDLNESVYSVSDAALRDQVSVRIKLAQDYQNLLRRIREQDGFKNFLMPRTFAELIPPQRTDGPVVIINVHSFRCDALVVYGSAELIIHIPLSNLTFELVEDMCLRFTLSLKEAGVRERERVDDEVADSDPQSPNRRGAISPSRAPKRYAGSLILDVLKDLWTFVVQPVLERIEIKLADSIIADLPHVTWCPTGPLAFLPIHAAGIYGRRGMPDDEMKLFDIVVSSYTPTLSALLRPPHGLVDGWPSVKALVVSQPKTPGMSMLPGVASEVARIRKHLDGQVVHFDDKDATIEAVFRAMNEDRCQIIHLACHGLQNTEDPTESAFALHDGKLTLSRLMSSSVRNAEFAFLSACQTSTGDEKLPEEAVHLAAGMLAMGFKSVIGTMWSIGDQDAPIVADEVYRELKVGYVPGGGGLRTAYALHEAVKVLREKVGESNIVRWAPYVHFGI